MRTFIRTITIAVRQKVLFPDILENLTDALLNQFVINRWQTEWSLFTVRLWNKYTFNIVSSKRFISKLLS